MSKYRKGYIEGMKIGSLWITLSIFYTFAILKFLIG